MRVQRGGVVRGQRVGVVGDAGGGGQDEILYSESCNHRSYTRKFVAAHLGVFQNGKESQVSIRQSGRHGCARSRVLGDS